MSRSKTKSNTPAPQRSGRSCLTSILTLPMLIIALLWFWFGWRIEPSNGQIAILTKKTGKNLPPDSIIADSPEYKGVQLDVLSEGRYFRNPYTWSWSIIRATDIPAGKFGVLVRKYGKTLPSGTIIAPDNHHKGIVRDVLGTGRHRINPYAYETKLFNDIKIAPGHVGIVTSLHGSDLLNPDPTTTSTASATFLVGDGEKGVRQEVLKEGTHRLNPYLYSISIVNIQSQRFEFTGDDTIMFLTVDGFPITVEGTLEFNLNVDKVAQLTHEVGDMDDIMQKIILPSARGFFRIEGSKKTATEFIVGESRLAFQLSLENYLRKVCTTWGVSLNSVLIRDIIVPQEVASIIRDRELAGQESLKFEQQIIQAKSQADLEREKALAIQNSAKVTAETKRIRMTIVAEQQQIEKTVAARTEYEVANIQLRAARADAEATLKLAEAERSVIEAQNNANAQVLKEQLSVYPKEHDFIRARLHEKTAPNIRKVMTTDQNRGLYGLPVGQPATPKGVQP